MNRQHRYIKKGAISRFFENSFFSRLKSARGPELGFPFASTFVHCASWSGGISDIPALTTAIRRSRIYVAEVVRNKQQSHGATHLIALPHAFAFVFALFLVGRLEYDHRIMEPIPQGSQICASTRAQYLRFETSMAANLLTPPAPPFTPGQGNRPEGAAVRSSASEDGAGLAVQIHFPENI